MIGKQLGSYDVLEKLGEGGMGEVYRARDPRLHREVATESGRPEVYLQQFPASGVKYQVSTGGGAGPKWRADARELYYLENGTLYAVPITFGSAVDIGTPKALGRNPIVFTFAAAADGQRFLIALPAGGSDAAQPITAVLNWAAGLKR